MKASELKQIIKEEIEAVLVNNKADNYMFFQNLKTIKDAVDAMLQMDPAMIDQILSNGHDWANDHITTSKDDVEEVYNFLKNYNSQLDEKALSPKQKKIAAAAPPEDKITGADFAALRKEKSSNLSESQQLQSLEQQAKDFVSKYGKVKVKI